MEQKSLAVIVRDHNALVELILESEGAVCPTLEDWLAVDSATIAQKVDSYKFAIDSFQSNADFMRAKAKQFSEAAKRLENVVERIKWNLKFQMREMKVDEIRGSDFRFKLSAPIERVIIDDVDAIPPKFTDEEIILNPNRERIKEALKAGEVIPGARLDYSNSLLSYVNTSEKKRISKIEVPGE